ncbi:MAG: LamG domain-containing protein, partial [Planctomycetaceae bacterium]
MWRRLTLPTSIVLVLCLAGSARAGLIGHWKLEEGSGTTVKDSSGKNNNGRFVGAPTWVTGKLGKALDFDGVDDYVEVPHSASLIPTKGKATVSLWINARRHTGPGGSQWQGIFAKGSWDPRLFNLYTEASQVLHFSTGPGTATIGSLSTGKVPLNEWVHVAVAVDGRHIYYINGEPAGEGGQGATVPATGSAALTIGQTGGSDFFSGMIDDVLLYDRALTADQIKGVMGGTLPVFGKAENPNPSDGATGVTLGLLTWTPGDAAVFENVYFGTTPDLTDADLVASRQPASMKFYVHQAGLISGQTYYWRVDGIDAAQTVYKGDVWNFTAAPVKSYAPSPADGARYVMP